MTEVRKADRHKGQKWQTQMVSEKAERSKSKGGKKQGENVKEG